VERAPKAFHVEQKNYCYQTLSPFLEHNASVVDVHNRRNR
jgi:hypothetical protein